MKKVILLLIIFFSFVILNAQTITMHSIGFKSATGTANKLQEGVTINVRSKYTTTDPNVMGPHADNDKDYVWVDKFTTSLPTVGSYDSSIKVSISGYGWEGIGADKYCWFNIVCPSVIGIKSIQLRFGLWGQAE